MSFADACDQLTADGMRRVQHETFGHLFPSNGRYWTGKLRVALSAYGSITILDTKIGIDDSPWWYASLNGFATECAGAMKDGEVAEFHIGVKREILEDKTYDPDDPYDEPKNEEVLVISEITKKILVEGW